MLAVVTGGPTAADVRIGELPQPIPNDGEVLVRVEAAGMNPYDLSLTTGFPTVTHLALPPGRDLAGTVVDGPPGLRGTRVWATGGELGRARPGFHAEFAVLPAQSVRPIPEELTMLEAGTIGVAYSTAWWALVDAGGIVPLRHGASGASAQDRPRVIVTGAAGAVGGAAVLLARWLGARRVWGLDHNTPQLESVAAAADVVTGDIDNLITTAQAEGGATVCLDTIGGSMLDTLLPAMAPAGRITVISTPGDGRAEFDLRRFYRDGLVLYGVNGGHHDVLEGARVLEAMTVGFADGSLVAPFITGTYPLEDATNAYQRLAQRQRGKLVFVRKTEDV